jgi:hypothetical protein
VILLQPWRILTSVYTVSVLNSARSYRELKIQERLAIQSKHCSTECTKPALVELTTVHRSPRLSRPVTTPNYTEPHPALHPAAEATRCTGCRSGPGGTAGGLGSSAARPPSPPGDDVVQLRELEQLRPAARSNVLRITQYSKRMSRWRQSSYVLVQCIVQLVQAQHRCHSAATETHALTLPSRYSIATRSSPSNPHQTPNHD